MNLLEAIFSESYSVSFGNSLVTVKRLFLTVRSNESQYRRKNMHTTRKMSNPKKRLC